MDNSFTKELSETKDKSFTNKDISGQDFSNKDLSSFDFNGSILERCNFSFCNLSHASFIGSDLYRCRFDNANLYNTIFKDANLTRATFINAKMYGIRMFGADLTRAKFDEVLYEEKAARTHEDFIKAAEVYTHLNFCLKDNGLITSAASYYYRSRVCLGKAIENPILRVLNKIVFGYMFGYGEKLSNVIVSSLIVSVIFGFIYFIFPLFNPFSGLFYQNRPLGYPTSNITDIFYSTYYSMLTFVGSSPNDPSPSGWAQMVSLIEVLIGISYMAIALTVIIKKIIRE